MTALLRKIIGLTLIITLILPRIVAPVTLVYAEDSTEAPKTEQPPASAPAPTSPPAPTSAPAQKSDAVAPTSPPAPTSAPAPSSAPQPSIAPAGNSGATGSSGPSGTTAGNTNSASSNTTGATSNTGNTATGGSQGNNSAGGTNQPLAGPNGAAAAAYKALYGTGTGGSNTSGINDPANTNTGPFSDNRASESAKTEIQANSINQANLNNFVNVMTNTGFNYANLNTLPGSIVTGDATNSVNLLNKLNSNVTGIGGFSVSNIYGNQVGDLSFTMGSGSTDSFSSASGQVSKNAVTGPGSDNVASASDAFTVKEANGNDAKIVNDVVLKAITGGNDASFNTGAGTIKTGNASALANIINLANTNINAKQWLFAVVNVIGSLYGNIILPSDAGDTASSTPVTTVQTGNTATGPGSDNTASTTATTDKVTQNTNNADITSNLNVGADTGNNKANMNTGASTVKTGDAQGIINNTSVANVNANNEDGTVWMVIVNEMGKWVGKIIGMPTGQTVASNLPITTSSSGNPQQTVTTTNGATGPLSGNTAAYDATNTQTTTNTNNAAIVNNVNVQADTGNNKASFNTGGAKITTGNAKAGINILNLANVNVTAKKFVVVFVNVLGSFFGDIVTPGQKAERTVPGPTAAAVADSHTGNAQAPAPTAAPTATVTTSTVSSTTTTVTTQSSGAVSTGTVKGVSTVRRIARARQMVKIPNAMQSRINQLTASTGQIGKYHRGVYLSPAFVQATEFNLTALLFRGAQMNVTYAWLGVVPFAVGLWIIRRRHIDLSRYVNSFLELML